MSGALGKMAIVIILALVLAFLVSVAPVSAVKKCSDSCGAKIKDLSSERCWPEQVATKICKTSRGTKWLVKDRTCCAGDYIRWCYHREPCSNKKYSCAQVGDAFKKVVGHYKTCTPWKKQTVYT